MEIGRTRPALGCSMIMVPYGALIVVLWFESRKIQVSWEMYKIDGIGSDNQDYACDRLGDCGYQFGLMYSQAMVA